MALRTQDAASSASGYIWANRYFGRNSPIEGLDGVDRTVRLARRTKEWLIRTTSLIHAGLLLAASWSQASAENGCPSGYTPNAAPTGTPGANQCIPIPGYGGPTAAPAAPRPVWVKRWGAYAFDEQASKVGMAGGMSSEGRARKAAIAHCKSKGGLNCQIQMTYHNQCAVVVSGEKDDGRWSTSFQSAPTLEEASSLAEAHCSESGASGCRLFFSDCSYAELAR